MTCLSCLDPVHDGDYHPRCLRRIFGITQAPEVGFDLAHLHRAGLEMVGQVSLSGVQQKVALGLSQDRRTLEIRPGARYVLKPQIRTLPHVPENEHVTMKIAQHVGIDTPPCTLLRLTDGSLAYVVERFDRTRDGRKLRQEDFCQLARLPPKAKYEGSVERCVKLLGRYATAPKIALLAFYRQIAFTWWTGNGDAHLKNFAVVEEDEVRLSPVYDQVCTRLVLPNDALALSIKGRKERLTVGTWRYLASYSGLPDRAAARALTSLVTKVEEAVALVERCYLPADMKTEYVELLRERGTGLKAAARALA